VVCVYKYPHTDRRIGNMADETPDPNEGHEWTNENEGPDPDDGPPEPAPNDDDGNEPAPVNEPAPDDDTFSRDYVEGLRRENASYRERARVAESGLWRALVEQTGRVANADEVPRPDGAPVSR